MRKRLKLFNEQKEGLRGVLNELFSLLFMDPGTGKTAIAIRAIDHRFRNNQCKRALVFAPSTILYNWTIEIKRFMIMKRNKYSVYMLGYGNRQKWKDNMHHAYEDIKRDKPVILIVNFEKARVFYEWLRKFDNDFCIIDELHFLRNHSDMSNKIYYLTRKSKYRLGMTGTPVCGGYEDLYMEYKIIDESVFGTNFKPFENRYIRYGGYGGYQIVGYKHKRELRRIMKETSYQVKLEDCVDLPPINEEILTCELTPQVRKIYDRMAEDMLVQIDHMLDKGITRQQLKEMCRNYDIYYDPGESYISLFLKVQEHISTSSCDLVVTQIMRLQQITGGFITMDSQEIDGLGSNKIKIVKDLISSAKRPVVVACQYVPEVNILFHELSDMKRGGKTITVRNFRDQRNRDKIYVDFQKGLVDVLIIQINSGGIGLNFQVADMVIIYSGNSSYEKNKQLIHRIKRRGQKHSMRVCRLITERTVDEDILESYHRHKDMAEFMD